MKTHPILFSGEMVRALLDGRKTQTRRVFLVTGPLGDKSAVTSPDEEIMQFDDGTFHYRSTGGLSGPYPCPYGQPGDLLWVRETFFDWGVGSNRIQYKTETSKVDEVPWSPSIHMPRWASRLTLKITDVRVERLQGISREDVLAEGIQVATADVASLGEFHACYRGLWNSLNAKRGYSWETNPWVWALTFKPINPGKDG